MTKFFVALLVLLAGSILWAAVRKLRGGAFFERSDPREPQSLKEMVERDRERKEND